MRKVSLEGTEQTPVVILDKESAKFEIRGYSFSDNAHGFYTDIVNWFKEYAREPNEETKLILDFKYVNSTSVKFLNDILKKLDAVAKAGKKVLVEWWYEPDDEDILQMGTVLKEFHPVEFKLLTKEIKKGGKKKMF